jgi:hypothetical protein
MKIGWYAQRLGRMEFKEVIWRLHDKMLQQAWRVRGTRSGGPHRRSDWRPVFANRWSVPTAAVLPPSAVQKVLQSAEGLLGGHWRVFDRKHPCFGRHPDWFVDARSKMRAEPEAFSFDIDFRNEKKVGNIKYIWEPSRHHHLTVLATAYALSRDPRYAEHISHHLNSWWEQNPFLCGPHWISGIEIGIRLISWVWTRRLLDGWPEAGNLFEENPRFVKQLYQHLAWLAALPSRGSSANNHLVAEAAGMFVASVAFPNFPESKHWQRWSAAILAREATAQTFPSGLNRELASEYHGLVLELLLAAAVEGEFSEVRLNSIVWERIRAMTDALAAIVDSEGRPPRQGDADDGVCLLLDAPSYDRWNSLLATGARLFGRMPWWPRAKENDVRTAFWTAGVGGRELVSGRPKTRPALFPDAGQAILRSHQDGSEVWCRCDSGPHGYLSIAAHAHADALSLEVRVGEIDVLADPGTYCYHGEAEWRDYFRSTRAHNTVELLGQDQSTSAGPFLWIQHAEARLLRVEGLDDDSPEATWEAEHRGYVGRGGPAHRRTITLNRRELILTVTDRFIQCPRDRIPVRLSFHLGPALHCTLTGRRAMLAWKGGTGELQLPDLLTWSLHFGEVDPPLGWFSPSFGHKTPSWTLVGLGEVADGTVLTSQLAFFLEAERDRSFACSEGDGQLHQL